MHKIKEDYIIAMLTYPSIYSIPERIKRFKDGTLTLERLFTWRGTPKGYDFWKDMHIRELGGRDIRESVLRIICEDPEDCTGV